MARAARKNVARHVPESAKRPSHALPRRLDPDSSESELEYTSSSDAGSPKDDERPNAPSSSLIEHMTQVLLPHINLGKRLPFLRRNLRACFERQSRLRNLSGGNWSLGHNPQPCPGVSVLYCTVNENQDERHRFEGSISSWVCPLCNLLGTLRSREELEFHLKTRPQRIPMFVDRTSLSRRTLWTSLVRTSN